MSPRPCGSNRGLSYIAISACNLRSSSSSSSSSTRCVLPLTSVCGAWGNLPTVSLMGTFPVRSMSSSSFSCCSSASSSSSSSSSIPLVVTPEVMASLISSPIACCSRRSSLWWWRWVVSRVVLRRCGEERDSASVHDVVDLVDGQACVYLLHGRARVLHRIQCLLVDVCRLDAVDFALECHNLRAGLFERVLKLFLSPQCCFGRCDIRQHHARHVTGTGPGPLLAWHGTVLETRIPALLLETNFRARLSCSSIWFCRCFSRFVSISSWPRNCSMAFFGASFLFWPPPNQPSPQPLIVEVVLGFVCQILSGRVVVRNMGFRWAIELRGGKRRGPALTV